MYEGSSSFIQNAKLAESAGTFGASWKSPGSNPGPWAPKRSALTNALHSPVQVTYESDGSNGSKVVVIVHFTVIAMKKYASQITM
jgi:hypothetical protein